MIINNKPNYQWRVLKVDNVNVLTNNDASGNLALQYVSDETYPSIDKFKQYISRIPDDLRCYSTPNHRSGFYINQQGILTTYGDYNYYQGRKVPEGTIIRLDLITKDRIVSPIYNDNLEYKAYRHNPIHYPDVSDRNNGYVVEVMGYDLVTEMGNDPYILTHAQLPADITPDYFVDSKTGLISKNIDIITVNGFLGNAVGESISSIYNFDGYSESLYKDDLRGNVYDVKDNKVYRYNFHPLRFPIIFYQGDYIFKRDGTMYRTSDNGIVYYYSYGKYYELDLQQILPKNVPVTISSLLKENLPKTGNVINEIIEGYPSDTSLSLVDSSAVPYTYNTLISNIDGGLENTTLSYWDNVSNDIMLSIPNRVPNIFKRIDDYYTKNIYDSQRYTEYLYYNKYILSKYDPTNILYYRKIYSSQTLLSRLFTYPLNSVYNDSEYSRFQYSKTYYHDNFNPGDSFNDRDVLIDNGEYHPLYTKISDYGVDVIIDENDTIPIDCIYLNHYRADKDNDDKKHVPLNYDDHYKYVISQNDEVNNFWPVISAGGTINNGVINGNVIGYDKDLGKYRKIAPGSTIRVTPIGKKEAYTAKGATFTEESLNLTLKEKLILSKFSIPLVKTLSTSNKPIVYDNSRNRLFINGIFPSSKAKPICFLNIFKEDITSYCSEHYGQYPIRYKVTPEQDLDIYIIGGVTLFIGNSAVTVKPARDGEAVKTISIIDEINKGNLKIIQNKRYTTQANIVNLHGLIYTFLYPME